MIVASIGIAIGSVLINRLLKSEVSARFVPVSVIGMAVFVLLLHFVSLAWSRHNGRSPCHWDCFLLGSR